MPHRIVPDGQSTRADAAHTPEGVREVRERFWLVFDNVPAPCAIYDGDRRFRFVNKALMKFLGRAAEHVIGRRDEELLPAQVTDVYLPHLRRAIETGLPQTAECAFNGPLGAFYYIANYIPLLDESGRVVEVLGMTNDSTQQRHVEYKLRRRDQELRSLTDNVPDVIGRFNRQLQHVFVNRQIEQITGLKVEAYLGRTVREMGISEELVCLWETSLTQVFDSAQPASLEFTLPGLSGPRSFESRLIPEFDAQGVVETVLVVNRDITERKLAQSGLSESEERFRSSFDAAPIGMIMIGLDHTLLKVNQAFCRMLDYTQEELTGLPVLQITHPGDKTATAARLDELTGDGTAVHITEKRYLAKDGRVVWARVTSTAVNDSAGRRVHGLAQIEDITTSRRVKQELERHRAHLEELVSSRTRALEASQQTLRSAERMASLGTLAAGIAHEINNPVGTILLAAEMGLAAWEGGDDQKLVSCLTAIKEDAQRCGRIVKNVLSFARQEPTDKGAHNLNEVVRRSVERVLAYAMRRNATLQVELDAGVEPVLMNPVAIEQAMTSILRNAIESRPEAVAVTISTTITDDACLVSVKDTGLGISPEVQVHMFDPFFTTRRASGGMGLGLSLVHGTINDHGGRIHIDSTIGQGTTFTIELLR
jgi:PAS domain S-box-containing protein